MQAEAKTEIVAETCRQRQMERHAGRGRCRDMQAEA